MGRDKTIDGDMEGFGEPARGRWRPHVRAGAVVAGGERRGRVGRRGRRGCLGEGVKDEAPGACMASLEH